MTGVDPELGLRVAVAHDYCTQFGGAERVALAMLRAFPNADLYTTLYAPSRTFPQFRDRVVHTSWLNRMPLLRREHRAALPLLTLASSGLHVDADVVLCSSSGWSHGFRTNGTKIVYCHTPARFVYLPEQYLGQSGRAFLPLLRAVRPGLRAWDRRAAAQCSAYLANSRTVARRIEDAYGIVPQLLPAPQSVDTAGPLLPLDLPWGRAPFHLLVSRLLPYKNVDVAIEAFRGLPDLRLLVVGRGPLAERLAAQAPANVAIRGGLSDAQLRWAYSQAVSLVAPSHEDYGLSPLEAAVFGVPSVALRAGGYLDTVEEGITGVFFDDLSPEGLRAAVGRALATPWSPNRIRAHAEDFSEAAFAAQLRHVVAQSASWRAHTPCRDDDG